MDDVRSILYVPAHRGDWVANATTEGADAVILDLEDSVPGDEKPRARRNVTENAAALSRTDTVVTLRVNRYGSDYFYDDVDTIGPWLDALVLPKVESGSEVRSVAAVLEYVERRREVEEQIEVVPLIETAAGIYNAYDVCVASDRVTAVGSGTSRGGDVQRSLDLGWSPEGLETLYLRSKIVLEARTAGVEQILSGVWATIDDDEGLREKARRQKRLGFTGMQAIHPTQVGIIDDVFTPTTDEVAYYRALVDAFEGSQHDDRGAIEFEGEVVDAAALRKARRVLERADEFGVDTA